MNRYWVALAKGVDQVIVRVEAADDAAARRAAQVSAPEGYVVVGAGLLRKG
jgi:hypothetical protein